MDKITARIDSVRIDGRYIFVNKKYSDPRISKMKMINMAQRDRITRFFEDTPKRGSYFVTYEKCSAEESNSPFPFYICWLPGDFHIGCHLKRTVKKINFCDKIIMFFERISKGNDKS